MFHKTGITPKLADEFIEITHESMSRFKELVAEDKTNLTPTNRPVDEYNRLLRIDLEELILRLSRLAGRPIDILDSGCGQCVAIDELLSNPKLKNALGSCTGISMNYFTHVEKVMAKHGDRLVYCYGKTQDVLENTKRKFDLILDQSGAHIYSVDKIYLLKLYFEALRSGGRAEVSHNAVTVQIPWDTEGFYTSVSKKFARTFFDKNNKALTIYKPSENAHFPLPKVVVYEYSETAASGWHSYSIDEERKGNGVAPGVVKYKFP